MREGFERGSGQIDGEEIRMQRLRLRHCQRVKILDVTEEGGQGNDRTKQRVISISILPSLLILIMMTTYNALVPLTFSM